MHLTDADSSTVPLAAAGGPWGKPCRNRWEMVQKPWENHGKTMGKPMGLWISTET